MHVVLFYSDTDPDHAEEWHGKITRMLELLSEIDGFIDVHYAKLPDSRDFAIAYFENEESIAQWYHHPEHLEAMKAGRDHIFKDYKIEVCEVVRAYTKETSLFDQIAVA
jgi:heme-degrading monooxygenase HmoA